MQAVEQAAKLDGPELNPGTDATKHTIKVIDITSASVEHDITGASGKLPKADGRMLKIVFSVDTYYAWGPTGGTIDEAAKDATNPTRQCSFQPANQPFYEYPSAQYLYVKRAGSADGLARLSVASP